MPYFGRGQCFIYARSRIRLKKENQENQSSLSHATAKEIGSKHKQEVLFKNRITKKSDILMIFETETLMLSAFLWDSQSAL